MHENRKKLIKFRNSETQQGAAMDLLRNPATRHHGPIQKPSHEPPMTHSETHCSFDNPNLANHKNPPPHSSSPKPTSQIKPTPNPSSLKPTPQIKPTPNPSLLKTTLQISSCIEPLMKREREIGKL
jgi:hypothetical protein